MFGWDLIEARLEKTWIFLEKKFLRF